MTGTTPTETPAPARPGAVRAVLRATGTLALVAAAGAAAWGLGAVLHARTGAEDAPSAHIAAIPVAAAPLRLQDGHEVETRHLGRVEAARAVALAFDLPGRVAEVRVEEGDRVAEGQPLARLDVARLQARLAELDAEGDAIEARAELARRTLGRQETLRDRGHATEQRLDEARLELDRLAAERARVEAARDSLQVDLDESVLRAPFAGEIAARHIDEGAVASPGSPALELVEVSRPQVRLGLAAPLAATLSPGDVLEVEIGGVTHEGVVAAVRPDLDPATRTRAVLLDLSLKEGASVAFGETAEAVMTERRPGRGAWAPLSALREGERGLWDVLTVEPGPDGPVAGRESVEVLQLSDDRAFVRGSFRDGAQAILSGPHRVAPGDPVAPQAPDEGAPQPVDLFALTN